MRSFTEQPVNLSMYTVGYIRFTTPKKRLVQFTQQSSSKVNLRCRYLSPKPLNVYMRMINSYLIFTLEKESTAAQFKLRFHNQGGG